MTEMKDPVRLSLSGSPGVQDLLRSARGDKNGIGGDTRRSKPSILRYAPFPKVGTTATMRPLRKIYLVALFQKNGYMDYMENSQKIKKNVVPIPRVAKIFSYLIPTTFSIY